MRKPTRVTNAGMALAVLFFLTLGGAPLVEAKTKVATGTGHHFESRARACSFAKSDAEIELGKNDDYRWRVVGYSACDCSQTKSDGDWVCTVEVRGEKDDD